MSFEKTVRILYNEEIDVTSFRIGPPLDQIIRNTIKNISAQKEREFIEIFRSLYRNCGYSNTFCYEGIQELLRRLVIKKTKIYIATHKPLYITTAILKKLNLDYFCDVCAIDSVGESTLSKEDMISLLIKRNRLERDVTIMIGDSVSDIVSAQDNHIRSAGVGYGYGETELILEANPDLFFTNVAQMADFLLR